MALDMLSLEQISNGTDFMPSDYDNATSIPNATFDYNYGCQMIAGNYSYLNVSCDSELQYSVPLYGYCTPFLLLITMTANSLIVIVLSRRNMATPTNSVLMGKFSLQKYFLNIVLLACVMCEFSIEMNLLQFVLDFFFKFNITFHLIFLLVI